MAGVLLLLDEKAQPTGLFTLYTSQGQVVIIFEDQERLREFAADVAAWMAQDGSRVGLVNIGDRTFDEAVALLLGMDPTMAGQAAFLSDSDPLSRELIKQVGER